MANRVQDAPFQDQGRLAQWMGEHGYLCIEGGEVPPSLTGLIEPGFSVRWFPDCEDGKCVAGRHATLHGAILDALKHL